MLETHDTSSVENKPLCYLILKYALLLKDYDTTPIPVDTIIKNTCLRTIPTTKWRRCRGLAFNIASIAIVVCFKIFFY